MKKDISPIDRCQPSGREKKRKGIRQKKGKQKKERKKKN